MAAALLMQYAIVSLAVAASAAFVVQKQWPAGVRRMRIACAVRMLRETRPAWMRSSSAIHVWMPTAQTSSAPHAARSLPSP